MPIAGFRAACEIAILCVRDATCVAKKIAAIEVSCFAQILDDKGVKE
jgi:hypothetical protein